jgi:hypothetical protein
MPRPLERWNSLKNSYKEIRELLKISCITVLPIIKIQIKPGNAIGHDL